MLKPGDIVTWTSQASGVEKTKTGKVITDIKPGKYIVEVLKRSGLTDIPCSRIKASSISYIPRVLIEVPRGGKSKLCDYYAPRANQKFYVESRQTGEEGRGRDG